MTVTINQIREIRNLKLWARQIHFWRTHLDIFIESYLHSTSAGGRRCVTPAATLRCARWCSFFGMHIGAVVYMICSIYPHRTDKSLGN